MRFCQNFYLTGFCLVLLIVIGRIYTLLKQVNKLEATSEALRKQAEGAAAAYKAISAEVDEAKLSAKAAKPVPEPRTLTRAPNPDPTFFPEPTPKPEP